MHALPCLSQFNCDESALIKIPLQQQQLFPLEKHEYLHAGSVLACNAHANTLLNYLHTPKTDLLSPGNK